MVLEGNSSQEYLVNTGGPQGSTLGPILFLLYINGLPDDVIFNIAIYADIQRYAKCEQVSNLWQQLLNLNLIYMIVWIVAGSCVLISMLEKKKKKWLHLTCLITLVLLM